MITTGQQVLDAAYSQLGYIEGPNNDSIFGVWYGANNAPWCAEYVSWAVYTACHANGEASPLEGIQNDKGAAYVPYIVDWARRTGVWVPNPARARLVCFDWNNDGVADHIGICTSDGDPYGTIEGNTSPADNSNGGMVMERQRSNSQGYSLGFVDLPYSSAPVAPPAPAPAPAPSGAPAWPGRFFVVASPLMNGGDVRQWQQQMANRGWNIAVDGWYGRQSAGVAIRFQQDKGLEADGVVGPVTWTASWTAPVT
jgi:hypothetical protein